VDDFCHRLMWSYGCEAQLEWITQVRRLKHETGE